MKKLLLVAMSLLFSVTAIAHSGHTPFEFVGVIEVAKHYLSSSYHIAAMLAMSAVLIVSAVLVCNSRQILSTILMVLGLMGSILGVGLLLS